jgi:DNA topoisomerase-3
VKRVVLAEKPSVARDLAAFLGARNRRDGFLEGGGTAVTWAFGHLVELKEPHEYDPLWKRWTLFSLPIVPSRFELRPRGDDGARRQLETIATLFAAADEIVAATDAGREGELIFRYILDYARATRPGLKSLKRLWLNSLTEEAIADAFTKLKDASEYDRLAAAARCRSEADWIIGINGTRFFTVSQRRFDVLWSVGRVQTPVLAMIVGRDDEIRTFVPEVFFELVTRYRGVVFQHPGKRFATRDEAAELLGTVAAAPLAISKVTKKKEVAPPPQLFDLTELQREMNRRHGMSAQATLDTAQALYEGKLLTYPRTDSRYLPNDQRREIPRILSQLRDRKPDAIGSLDLEALKESTKVFDDAKVADHHAILPTGKTPGSLPPDAERVFDAVLTRLVAVFSKPCEKEVTTVEAVAAEVPFKARGVRIVEPGWTTLYPRLEKKRPPGSKAKAEGDAGASAADEPADDLDEQEMPLFERGESGAHEPWLKEGKTRPPRAYDENTLLGAMETAGRQIEDEALREAMKEKGLGTPATRAAIIETLIQRGYVRRDKKKLLATDNGRFLVYVVHDDALKSPELTGDWEAKLKAIEQGELDPASFMAAVDEHARRIVKGHDPRPSREELGRGLGRCPRCRADILQGQRGYGCSRWKEGCDYVLWMDYRGVRLDARQARELLTRRILLEPVEIAGEGARILALAPRGQVMELAVPQRETPGPRAARRPQPRQAPGASA